MKIPVGAVFTFSADNAVALTNYMDPKVEAMRLSGDVRIQVTGGAHTDPDQSRPYRARAHRG